MKALGMTRLDAGDVDCSGCSGNGRATRVYNLPGKGGDTHAFRSLRNGKKAAVRRLAKRSARAEDKKLCREES